MVAQQDTFQGLLTAESPLRKVLGRAVLPITSPVAQWALLGEPGHETEQEVYFLRLACFTADQKEAMAQFMAGNTGNRIEEAREALAKLETIPVRAMHFNGVSFPLRFLM